MKRLSLFTHPKIVLNLYEFHSSVNQTATDVHSMENYYGSPVYRQQFWF